LPLELLRTAAEDSRLQAAVHHPLPQPQGATVTYQCIVPCEVCDLIPLTVGIKSLGSEGRVQGSVWRLVHIRCHLIQSHC